MKAWKLFVLPTLLISFAANAGMSDLKQAFLDSDVFRDTLRSLEREHHASCDVGRVKAFIPGVFKKITYKAKCGSIDLKIKAKFKNKDNPEFILTKVKVWSNGLLGLKSSEEFIFSSDPFLKAYKNSQLVRDIRHFVENEYQVVCKKGRVRKGRLGGKANYFYFTKCKGDNKKIKIKLKSKVHVFGDRFKFNLTKYKLTF